MKTFLSVAVVAVAGAVFGAGASAPNAISFEGYTSATTLQLVNGVNEYDEDGTQELYPYFFFEGATDASIVKTFGGDNLAAPAIARPSFFAGATPNDNYLEVDTASGTLWRSFAAASSEGMGAAQGIAAGGTTGPARRATRCSACSSWRPRWFRIRRHPRRPRAR